MLVLLICLGCVGLGSWQLSRLSERRLNNAVQGARYDQPPIPLVEALSGAGADIESLEYRHVTVRGEYLPDAEVLLRSRVRQSQVGFEVVTPLATDAGIVMVNRGWVPLEFDTPPVAATSPPAGEVTVEGLVRFPSSVATDPEIDNAGRAVVLTRVDPELIESQVEGDVLDFYLMVEGNPTAAALPVPAPAPNLSDEGSHFSYAVQWFSFAVIGVVGYGLILRRQVRRSSREGESFDDGRPGEPGEVAPRKANLGASSPGSDND